MTVLSHNATERLSKHLSLSSLFIRQNIMLKWMTEQYFNEEWMCWGRIERMNIHVGSHVFITDKGEDTCAERMTRL